GGVSRVNPWRVIVPPPQGEVIADVVEVIARKSAVPTGAGNVVTSTIRNRRRVTAPPVVLVNLRRSSREPEFPLPLRTRFGSAELGTQGATSEAFITEFRCIGLERFSGPGAPSRGPAGVKLAPVSAKTKSF